MFNKSKVTMYERETAPLLSSNVRATTPLPNITTYYLWM